MHIFALHIYASVLHASNNYLVFFNHLKMYILFYSFFDSLVFTSLFFIAHLYLIVSFCGKDLLYAWNMQGINFVFTNQIARVLPYMYTFVYILPILCLSFFLALASEFLLHSLISFVVVPDGFCYVFLAVQDTSRKIVTCPIMYLPCSRHIHIFSNVSACTYIFSLIFMHTYFASTNLVLCMVFIYKYSVLHTQLETHGYASYFPREFIYLWYQWLYIWSLIISHGYLSTLYLSHCMSWFIWLFILIFIINTLLWLNIFKYLVA